MIKELHLHILFESYEIPKYFNNHILLEIYHMMK